MKKSRYLWILGGLIVAGAVYMWNWDWIGQQAGQTASPTPSGTSQVVKKIGTAATSSKTYTDLVAQYKDRRIQFDIYCQAIPNNITYKNGTTIMLDNRSGDARTITLSGTKYQLAGYGYALVTLYSPKLPKEMMISCGSAVNVGKILLQAKILQ